MKTRVTTSPTAEMLALLPKVSIPRVGTIDRADLRNVIILVIGFAAVLLLVPPARSYAMDDDWAYAQSVTRLLDLSYRPHDWTQPTSIGHIAWGALFSLLLGNNFTTLTIATLVMSAASLVLFYLVLRHLDVLPAPALLGAGLLGFNPLYVYLSYSFMTDITFLAYVLAGCLCFIRGVKGKGTYWFWLGSVATSLAYLTRQHGALLVLVGLFYLWWSRSWSWRSALAIAALPMVTIVVYMLWERTQPAPLVTYLVADAMSFVTHQTGKFLLGHMQRATWVLAIPGLCLLPLLRLPRRPMLVLPLLALLLFFQFRSVQQYGTVSPAFGDLVDHTGFIMYSYDAAPIWTEGVWAVLGVIGAAAASLYLVYFGQQAWMWLRARPWKERGRDADPALLFYGVGLALAAVTFASPFLFDRYLLPLLPMVMLPSLRRMAGTDRGEGTRLQLQWRWLAVLPIALFSLLAQRDYIAHASARWEASEQLIRAGVPMEQIDGGFEWLGWHLFDSGAAYIRATGDLEHVLYAPTAVLDPAYIVSDLPQKDYDVVGSRDYTSWLSGGQERHVLMLKRK